MNRRIFMVDNLAHIQSNIYNDVTACGKNIRYLDAILRSAPMITCIRCYAVALGLSYSQIYPGFGYV